MKFCPKCDLRLKKNSSDSALICPKCGYNEHGSTNTKEEIKKQDTKSDINVIAESEGKETLPTIKIHCEKCGNDEAVWWMLQTRSADEPTTQFYRCIKCSYTWRNYA